MQTSLREIVESYDAGLSLAEAYAPPAAWYTDPRIFELERRTVFARSWQVVGRADQLGEIGKYITSEIAGDPVMVVKGNDGVARAFFNVCRHKGAAILIETEGRAQILRCPYHGWTYTLDGKLKGTPDFSGVQNFDPSANGLVSLQTALWQHWAFVRPEANGSSLEEFLGAELSQQAQGLAVKDLHWAERRHYTLNCNWKVFIDNYLDGGYHVPHLHSGLNSVLDYGKYTIENGEHYCVQSAPVLNSESSTAGVRRGDRAVYLWLYPNFMINWYEGVMDTNLVIPRSVDRTEVVFDFYFAGHSEQTRKDHLASIAVSEQIQGEDVAICESVQRGLTSPAYRPGRLSLRREAGEYLFHKLLYLDLKKGLGE